MVNFFGGIKALLQLIMLLRTIWAEYNKSVEEKRQAEADKRASRRAEIEKELARENLTLEEKRKLLSDLTNNLPY